MVSEIRLDNRSRIIRYPAEKTYLPIHDLDTKVQKNPESTQRNISVVIPRFYRQVLKGQWHRIFEFFLLDSISRGNSKTPHVLDFSISTFKSPKIAKNSRFRCLRTRIPVSANSYTGVVNSYTGVCELVYRCRQTRIPVLWNRIQGREYTISEHRYTSSMTPVYEFTDTGI